MLTWKRAAKSYRTLKLSKFRRKGRTEAEVFAAALAAAEDRDHILVFTCRWYMTKVDDWYSHPHGIFLRQKFSYSLNGVEPKENCDMMNLDVTPYPEEGLIDIYRGPYKQEEAVVRLGGRRTLYCGPCDHGKQHRHGALLRIGNEYRLVVAKKFDSDAVIC